MDRIYEVPWTIYGARAGDKCSLIFVSKRLAELILRKGKAGLWVTPYIPVNVIMSPWSQIRVVGVSLFSNTAIGVRRDD